MNYSNLEELGMREFGVVTCAKWKQSTSQVEVTVTTLNDNASTQDRVRFLQKATIICQFHHPNVIILYSVVTETPIMEALEHITHGSLRNFLM